MNAGNQNEPVSEPKKCPQCGATLPSRALAGLCPACLLKEGTTADSGLPEPSRFEAPDVKEVARLFPQLEILQFLGKGGMGAVYKARQPSLDRLVALKILPSQAGQTAGFADRFTREARALARLSHPNIVTVHEFGQVVGGTAPDAPAWPYFLMEFVDGLSLRQLEQAGRLAPAEAIRIIPQICDALQYAHDEGVVHRDIKPENILMDRKGRVKIADFGLAKILGLDPLDLRLTGEGQVMGTPHYMAPEQVENPLQVDHRADIFSLGVVFYEMLTGELPLGKFPPPSRKVRVDVRLDEVVLRALEKEPDRRYQQAGEVKTHIENITGQQESAPAPTASVVSPGIPAPAPPPPKSKWNLLWPAFSVLAFLIFIFVWDQMQRRNRPVQSDNSAPTAGATGVATQEAVVSWQKILREPAAVEVIGTQPLRLVTGNDWLQVPKAFATNQTVGFWATNKYEGVADFKVTKAGYLFVACHFGYEGNRSGGWKEVMWTPDQFFEHGWREMTSEDIGGVLVTPRNRELVVFMKRVQAGESGRIRCNKYTAPCFIMCSLPGAASATTNAALAPLPVPVPALKPEPTEIVYEIGGHFDASDCLVIRGETLQWRHVAGGIAAGRHNKPDETAISSTSNGSNVMERVSWLPSWPQPQPGLIRLEAVSSMYHGLNPPLPRGPVAVQTALLEGRGSLSVVQLPNAANDFTLIVRFADISSAIAAMRGRITIIQGGLTAAAIPSPQPLNVAPVGGLVAWWPGNGTAEDVAGGHNGTLVNGVTYEPGMVGSAFRFGTASGQRVWVPDSPAFQLTNSLTIEGWFKIYGGTALVQRGDNRPGLDPFTFAVESDGRLNFQIVHSSGADYVALRTPAAVPTKVWKHLAATLDGVTGTMRIYVDGQVAAQTNTTVRPLGPLSPAHDASLGLGNCAGHSIEFPFIGLADEVGLYSRALSVTEIQSIYTAGTAGKRSTPPSRSPTAGGLVAQWRAEDEGRDMAGHNDGTLVNGVSVVSDKGVSAFNFNGVRSGINVGNPASLQLQNFTIEAWIKRTSLTKVTLGIYQGANLFCHTWGGYALAIGEDGTLGFGKVGSRCMSSHFAVTDTNFHHVAVTKDGSNVVFYLDGVAESAGPYDPGFVFNGPAAIGARGGDYANGFLGLIARVSIYNRGLMASEIREIYNAGLAAKRKP